MTALPLEPHTEAEQRIADIEAAPYAPESAVERVALAMTATIGGVPTALTRRMAAAAIGAMKGPGLEAEALARVEALAERLGDESREFYYDNRHTHEHGINYVSGMSDAMEQIADRITAAIAAPLAGQHTTDEEGR